MNRPTEPTSISTRQSKRVYWSHHVTMWQESGVTKSQYCQQNQLNPHTFTYWRSKLEKHAANCFPSLLPVTVRPDSKQQSSGLHSGIVLLFTERLSIQLENGFNSDTLVRLIDLLEERSCSATL